MGSVENVSMERLKKFIYSQTNAKTFNPEAAEKLVRLIEAEGAQDAYETMADWFNHDGWWRAHEVETVLRLYAKEIRKRVALESCVHDWVDVDTEQVKGRYCRLCGGIGSLGSDEVLFDSTPYKHIWEGKTNDS